MVVRNREKRDEDRTRKERKGENGRREEREIENKTGKGRQRACGTEEIVRRRESAT